jgi:DNA-binding response OmpR family regulator
MSQPRFLVVDDATFTRDLIKKTLRQHFPGCPIDDANSARKAQSLAKLQTPDLILSDWEMPEISGEEFLRWVREQEKLATTPFIMVTSRGEREFVVKAIESGVSDFVGKPFTPEELVTKVSKQLKRIGKLPKLGARASVTDTGLGSLEVLTGKKSPDSLVVDALTTTSNTTNKRSLQAGSSAAVLTGLMQTDQQQANAVKQPKKDQRPKGQAQLVFAEGGRYTCLILNLTLQMLTGVLKRGDQLPRIFDQAVVNIVQVDGSDVARLNAYVHKMEASDQRQDSEFVKIQLRFIDDDADKLAYLSQFISSL